jgi:hypothetical protein
VLAGGMMLRKEAIIRLIDKNHDQAEKIIHEKVDIWTSHILFSGLWWLGVALTILPWIIWIIFRKKESTHRLLYVGTYVMVVSLALDVLGDQFGFWHYRFNVIPVLPTYFPWDVTLMPVTVMLFLQIKPNGNPVIKAILFALFAAYIAEPFFSWLQIYKPIMWKFSYSVPIQFTIYLIGHYLSTRDHFSKLTKVKG